MSSEKETDIDFKKFQRDWKGIERAFDRINKFSTWMTTVSLAGLAFFVTVLLQIRSQMSLPWPYLATVALGLLSASAIVGFYFRFRFELSQFGKDLHNGISAISHIGCKIIDKARIDHKVIKAVEQIPQVDSAEGFAEGLKKLLISIKKPFAEFQIVVRENNPFWTILLQAVAMGTGLVLSAIYISLYLFG